MLFNIMLLIVALVHYAPNSVDSHGYMLQPPSRMSAWRLGFDMPVNYNDNEMFCGGIDVQQKLNGGKCGLCGDSWSGPRPYERPNGTMVKHNIITKIYQESDNITIVLQITKNHWGWNEFRLCDIAKSGGVEASQECLNLNVLADDSGKTRFYFETDANGLYEYKLALPAGLTCSHCLLQWKWKCGNQWGCDAGVCGKGRGDYQEEFYACADVTIAPRLPTSGTYYITTENVSVSIGTSVLTESTSVTRSATTPQSTSESPATSTLKPVSEFSSTIRSTSEPTVTVVGSTSDAKTAQPNPNALSTLTTLTAAQETTQTILTSVTPEPSITSEPFVTSGPSVTTEPSVTSAPSDTTKGNFLYFADVLKILSGSSNPKNAKLNNTNSASGGNAKTSQDIMNLLIKQSEQHKTGTGNIGN